MKYLVSVVYVFSVVAANLTVNAFGPKVIPLVSFVLIGLDLTSRDYLHERFSAHTETKIFGLIALGGVGTYFANMEAGIIAVASVTAFAVSGVVDTGIYSWFSGSSYLKKANLSNAGGSLSDSALFCLIAFDPFPWLWFAGQCATKFFGGSVWAWVFNRTFRGLVVLVFVASLSFPVRPASAQDLYVTTHYDIRRQQPITSLVHRTPLPGKFFSNGFVEVWRNPSNGVPSNEWTVFSKHWVTRAITKRLSFSVGVEFIYNRPGVNFQWPKTATYFKDGRGPHLTPKVGLQYQIY